MFFRKRKEKKEETKRTLQVGDRFAIKYGNLSTPIYYMNEHPYSCAEIPTNYHSLDMGDIANLWTVVEYIGDNQYLDLITGEIIIKQEKIDDIKDTVTIEYEEEALQQQKDLLEHPIAIGRSNGYNYSGLTILTTEIKQSIMEESMTRQEEIISIIQEKKETARELIGKLYAKKNEDKMQELHHRALKENAEKERKLARQKAEAERIRKEEEKRIAQERLKAEIDPKFEKMFPIKKLIKR